MKMTYSEAIKKAVADQMKQDQNVVLMGQDVREWGGVSKVFKGLAKEFSSQVIDTPISEIGVGDMAVGMAMNGMRPIVEYPFIDFILHAADPIINQAAKVKFMSNGQFTAPVVSFTCISSGRGYGATHAQSLEHLFTSVPGLNVIYPYAPNDAYHLMKYALSCEDPTIFVTHKLLHGLEGNISDNYMPGLYEHAPRGIIRSEGGAVTLVSYGRMTGLALESASKVKGVEVIDLINLSKIDYELIERSVKKTGRLLLLEEGYGAVSSEIAATIAQTTFKSLKSPITRLHAEKRSIGANKEDEEKMMPNIGIVLRTISDMVK